MKRAILATLVCAIFVLVASAARAKRPDGPVVLVATQAMEEGAYGQVVILAIPMSEGGHYGFILRATRWTWTS